MSFTLVSWRPPFCSQGQSKCATGFRGGRWQGRLGRDVEDVRSLETLCNGLDTVYVRPELSSQPAWSSSRYTIYIYMILYIYDIIYIHNLSMVLSYIGVKLGRISRYIYREWKMILVFWSPKNSSWVRNNMDHPWWSAKVSGLEATK